MNAKHAAIIRRGIQVAKAAQGNTLALRDYHVLYECAFGNGLMTRAFVRTVTPKP